MAVKIRLMRIGAKKAPYYKVVVADSKAPRNSAYIDLIGCSVDQKRRSADRYCKGTSQKERRRIIGKLR